jgi:hypothetical protein
MKMRKLDSHEIGALLACGMAAVAIGFCVHAEYSWRNMQKVQVIRVEQAKPVTLEQVKTEAANQFAGYRTRPINLVMQVEGIGDKEGLRAAAAQFEVAQPGKHPGLPKPRPTPPPTGSPAEKPTVVASK